MALRAIGANLDPAVRVVVVRGAAARFSSGLDRRMLTPEGVDRRGVDPAAARDAGRRVAETITGYQEGFAWLRRKDLVSVAAVEGHAIGAGFQLALACDLRVVTDDAQMSMREALLGLVPDLTGTKPLVELVGYSRALEICATARLIEAEEAREIGLATVRCSRRASSTAAVADLVVCADGSALRRSVGDEGAAAERGGVRARRSRLRAEREAQVRRFRELAS